MGVFRELHEIQWLGRVWHFADQIGLDSGQDVPAETRWRCQAPTPALKQEEAQAGLLVAVARTRRLYNLNLTMWLGVVALVAWALYQLPASVRNHS